MGTPSNGQEVNLFDELIFKSELNEVHLLLDFISGRPDVQISGIDLKMPKPGYPDETLNTFETITYVCKLRYPPDPDVSNRAADAALLTLVKDKLSSLAYPARGATIAYTYTFIEPDGDLALPRDDQTRAEKRRTRTSVAREAYPGIYRNAREFRRVHRFMTAASIVLTVLAAVALWLVTYGVQITARFEDDRKQNADMVDKIYQQVKLQETKTTPGSLGHPTAMERRQKKYLVSQNSEISMLCNNWSYAQARYVKTISDACAFATHYPSRVLMLLFPSEIGLESRRCRDRSRHEEDDTTVSTTLASTDAAGITSTQRASAQASGSATRPRSVRSAAQVAPQSTKAFPGASDPPVSAASMGASAGSLPTTDVNADAQPQNRTPDFATQEDIQSITLILSIYSNYVLPIIFGFLGTAASMLRSIGDKIKDCVLAPRDAALSFLRLPLGLMAGVTVGLFFNPASVAQGISAGTGTLTITASGIAFLAGYGADAFFKMVDRVINQVFNVENGRDPKRAA